MVSIIIHQDTSAIPPMTSPVIDLISTPDSPNEHRPLPAVATATTKTTTSITTLPLPPQPQQSTIDSILIKRIDELGQHMADLVSKEVDEIVMDAVDWAIQALLRDCFSDLPNADMKEILHHRMWETNSYKAHEDHKKMYEALEKSMDRPSGTSGASETSRSSQLLPSHPPPSTNYSDQSKSTSAPSSSKTGSSAEYTAWTTTETRLKPSVSSILEDLHMDADSAPDQQVHSSDDEDIGNDHIPKVNLKQDWWKPLPEEDRPATPEPAWYNVSKPLPLGAQPGQVTIQADFFFNKDLEYLRYGSKGGRPALLISKMKAALLSLLLFKHDFTIIDSPRAVTFRDKYRVQIIMRFNEIHKFSDDTLQQIDEALDYRVKEFKVNRMNPGLNTRFWTRKDVDRSKEFMFAIRKWLKTRRIFRNLESFVSGRIRE
ncbi:hypothetical protein Tco_0256979 [Tanacetum coccineum]